MYLILAMISALALASKDALCFECSTSQKQGPFKLSTHVTAFPNITRLTVKVKKFFPHVPTATIVSGYRSYWKSYCYNGGALDPNTGCLNSLVNLPPDGEELKVWSVKNKCQVGKLCQDQLGSDSDCCSDTKPNKRWVENEEIEKRSTNNAFAHHTCNLSWRCGVLRSDLPIYMSYGVGWSLPRLFVPLSNGTLVPLKAGKLYSHGDFVVYVLKEPKVGSITVDLDCLLEGDSEYCVDHENNININFGKRKRKCVQRICYERLWSVDKGHNYVIEDLGAAASIEDLKTLMEAEIINSEKTRFSMAQMGARIIQLEKVLATIVQSLGKVDDRLLGEIIGLSFSTHYLNKEAFLVSPCLKEPARSSNCAGNLIYSDGRWIKNTNPANCIDISSPVDYYLFDPLSLWLPHLQESKVHGTSKLLPGWTFYAQEKENLYNTMLYTKHGGAGTALQDILKLPTGALHGMLGSFFGISGVMVIIVIVVFVVLFILCKRL